MLHHREGTGARSRRTLVRLVREERRPAVGRHLERLDHGVGRRVGCLRHRQQFGVRERLRPGGGGRRLVEVVDRDVARREQHVEARTEVVRVAHLHRLHRRVQMRRVVHERRHGLRRDVHAHHLPLRGGERVFHAVHGVDGHGVHRGEARGDRVRLGVGGAGERAFHEQALAPRVRGVGPQRAGRIERERRGVRSGGERARLRRIASDPLAGFKGELRSRAACGVNADQTVRVDRKARRAVQSGRGRRVGGDVSVGLHDVGGVNQVAEVVHADDVGCSVGLGRDREARGVRADREAGGREVVDPQPEAILQRGVHVPRRDVRGVRRERNGGDCQGGKVGMACATNHEILL